jgi:hypothetical protein
MDLKKINVKFYLEEGSALPLASFIPVFHRWIQEDLLEGLLVDVAEYTHVKEGPGVLLIAHEANYSLDEEGGKRGMLYNQKRVPERAPEEHLRTAFRRALLACGLLEREPGLPGKVRFAPGHFRVFVNDRLEAPHHAETHEDLEKSLKPFLENLYGGSPLLMIPQKDPRKRTGFEVKVEGPASLEDLLAKVS